MIDMGTCEASFISCATMRVLWCDDNGDKIHQMLIVIKSSYHSNGQAVEQIHREIKSHNKPDAPDRCCQLWMLRLSVKVKVFVSTTWNEELLIGCYELWPNHIHTAAHSYADMYETGAHRKMHCIRLILKQSKILPDVYIFKSRYSRLSINVLTLDPTVNILYMWNETLAARKKNIVELYIHLLNKIW